MINISMIAKKDKLPEDKSMVIVLDRFGDLCGSIAFDNGNFVDLTTGANLTQFVLYWCYDYGIKRNVAYANRCRKILHRLERLLLKAGYHDPYVSTPNNVLKLNGDYVDGVRVVVDSAGYSDDVIVTKSANATFVKVLYK